MTRLFKPPREPSAAGIMTYGFILGALTARRPSIGGAAAAAAALALHLFSFDEALASARQGRTRRLACIVAMNSAPYVAALLLLPGRLALVAALLAYIPVMAAYSAAVTRDRLSSAPGYVAGAAFLSYTVVLSAALVGDPGRATLIVFALYTAYTASTAAYVESKLPFRSVDPRLPLAIWLPGVAAAALHPLLLIACIEPTVKLAREALRHAKIPASQIKRIGQVEFARLTAFVAIVAAVLLLA